MVSVLTISDEVIASLWSNQVRSLDVDLILSAGDLPFDYIEYLIDTLDVPCVFVPGNHDSDLSGYSAGRAGWMRAGLPATWPGPVGAMNADRRIVSAAGLRIAGLGGSIRYNGGPNQWTERQQRRRANSLIRTNSWHPKLRNQGVDILLTHSPARGVGDAEDLPHRGFDCFDNLVAELQPQLFVHGHIHPHGTQPADRQLRGATVLNTVGYTVTEVTPGGSVPAIGRRRYGA